MNIWRPSLLEKISHNSLDFGARVQIWCWIAHCDPTKLQEDQTSLGFDVRGSKLDLRVAHPAIIFAWSATSGFYGPLKKAYIV